MADRDSEPGSPPPKCSVVIPVRNGANCIGRCLDALISQSVGGFELIVVDDGSTDDTAAEAEKRGATVIRQEPAGPAEARNRGTDAASADIVLFTDGDCEPAHDWVEVMLRPFDDQSVVGAKGAYYSRQTQPMARFVQQEYEEKYDRMSGFRQIDFIDTYSAGFRKRQFFEVGGFDTSFPNASVEDQEFSFRMAEAGHKMLFIPEARVYHLHVDNLRGYARKKFKIGFWKMRVLRRHPGKAVSDSHTPQILKLQVLLACGGAALLAVGAGSVFASELKWFLIAGLLATAGFLLSTAPMTLRVWKNDRPIARRTPGYLLTRSLALGAGMIAGLMSGLTGSQRN